MNKVKNMKISSSKKFVSKPVKRKNLLPKIYVWVVLALIYLPIFIIIVYSFNKSKYTYAWSGLSFDWYRELFRDRAIFEALSNSLFLAAISSLLAAAIGSLGAVGFSEGKLPFKRITEYISMLPIMIPEIILGMIFLTFMSFIKIPLGMPALIIGHTSFCIPYVYILVKGRLSGMDNSLVEAARDLGASHIKAFLTITMPLILPAIASGMILSFVMSFDDVIISVFVSDINSNTLPLYIYSQVKTSVTPKSYAICAMMFFVSIILVALSRLVGRINNKNNQTNES